MNTNKLDYEEIRSFVEKQPEGTRIYIGCDSTKITSALGEFADYTIAVVVHIGAKHGAKIFGEVRRDRVYDKNPGKPRMRLMTEVYLIAEVFLELAKTLPDTEIEVHLDVNGNEIHGSSCVVNEAIGYIRGMCAVEPKIKPQAWAASTVADRGRRLIAA